MSDIRDDMVRRPEEFEQIFIDLLDVWFEEREPDLLQFDLRSVAVLDWIGTAYAKCRSRTDGEPVPAAEQVALKTKLLSMVTVVNHEVRQDKMVLAQGQPGFGWPITWETGPLHPLRIWNRGWTDWTWVHYGRGPSLPDNEPELARCVRNRDPSATIFEMARQYDLPLLPLHSRVALQSYNYFAPTFTATIRAMKDRHGDWLIRDVAAVLEILDRYRNHLTKRHFGYRDQPSGATRVSRAELHAVLQRHDLTHVLPLFIPLEDGDPLVPLLFQDDTSYYFSPSMAGMLRWCLTNFLPFDGQPIHEVASSTFDDLISNLLSDLGYHTTYQSTRFTRVSLRKAEPNEVDVIVWKDGQALLVEGKFKIDHPGEWSEKRMDGEREKLEEQTTHLRKKIGVWRDALDDGQESVRIAGQTVQVPPELRDSDDLRGVLLSGRLEPQTDDTDVPVRTLVSPRTKEIIKRRVPDNEIMGLWDGQVDLWDLLD